jgi:hypothetical protein
MKEINEIAPEWIGLQVTSKLGNGEVVKAYYNSWETITLHIQTKNGIVRHHNNFVTVI